MQDCNISSGLAMEVLRSICWLPMFVRLQRTIDSRYIAVIYDTIGHTAQQLQWSDLHSRTTAHTSPYGRAMGCLSWDTRRKMIAIYWEHTVLQYNIFLMCTAWRTIILLRSTPDNKVHGANMGPQKVGPILAPLTLLSGIVLLVDCIFLSFSDACEVFKKEMGKPTRPRLNTIKQVGGCRCLNKSTFQLSRYSHRCNISGSQ